MANPDYDPNEDLYQVLELDPSASVDDVERAWKRLLLWHPDTNHDPEATIRMQVINLAHDILGNPETREEYDIMRDDYLAGSPPDLCTSIRVVDFGNIEPRDKAAEISVTLYNQGGDGVLYTLPEAGSYWSVTGAPPVDDQEAYALLVFSTDVSDVTKPDRYEDTIRIFLDNGKDISTVEVTIRANVLAVPQSPPSRPTNTPPRTTQPQRTTAHHPPTSTSSSHVPYARSPSYRNDGGSGLIILAKSLMLFSPIILYFVLGGLVFNHATGGLHALGILFQLVDIPFIILGVSLWLTWAFHGFED